jgi:hypothetical protein
MSVDTKPPRDRRRHERYQLLAQVHIAHDTTAYVLELGNLSRSGALLCLGSLRPPDWIALHRVVQVGIINPETLDTVTLSAQIVRTQQDADGYGFAVRFEPPGAASTEGLDTLLRLAARLRTRPPPLPEGSESGPPPMPVH